MTSFAVARSTFATTLARYSRSRGLWLLVLVAPVGARFMIASDSGAGVQIAVGRHLLVLTSAVLGVSLGIVVSTLLLPVAFVYLRSSVSRIRPWQIEDVTPASRVAIALGRFGADCALLFGALSALTLAGCVLGWFIVAGPLRPLTLAATMWLVAAPAVMGVAAIRLLFDALPLTRRAIGDLLYFALWSLSIAAPIALSGHPSSFAANMSDFAGFARPLVGPGPAPGTSFSIGSSKNIVPGRIPVDVGVGLGARGYIASRVTWAVLAVALAVFAGLAYRPRGPETRRSRSGRIARLLSPRIPLADAAAKAAPPTSRPLLNLIVAEFRLIGFGRAFTAFAAAFALLGCALATGAAAALTGLALASISGAAFAPRLALIVLWYGYFAS